MNTNDWLVKLCAEQPTNEAELEQALTELEPEDLMGLDPAPTPHLDGIQEKIAFADQMGRELAVQNPGLLQDAEAQALEAQQLQEAIGSLSDEEAVKVAHVLDNGTEMEKEAIFGAIKGLAAKALGSGAVRKTLGAAARNPRVAMSAAGAGAGAIADKDNRFRGALLGGGAGYGLSRTGVGMKAFRKGTKTLGRGHKWGLKQQGIKRVGKGGGYAASPLRRNAAGQSMPGIAAGQSSPISFQSTAAKAVRGKGDGGPLLKKAYLGGDHKNEWLEQFEGTPLLQQALGLARQELDAEMQDIESRQNEPARDEAWQRRDQLRIEKKKLELDLVAQRNGEQCGEGEPGGEEAPPEPGPQAQEEPQQPPNPAEVAAQSQPGQEAIQAIKEAGARLAASPSFPI